MTPVVGTSPKDTRSWSAADGVVGSRKLVTDTRKTPPCAAGAAHDLGVRLRV